MSIFKVSYNQPENYALKNAHKLGKLNEKEINTGTLGKIRQFLGKVLLKSHFSESFKTQTHLHAEHMSKGDLSGNHTAVAIGKTISILEKMNDPPKDLIKALTYARRISIAESTTTPLLASTVVGLGASNVIRANIIKRDIKKLKVGKSLAIPCDCQKHAMLLFITRQPNGKFKIVQHNQGLGIEFHYMKVDETGKSLYQTALEIEDVSEEEICGLGSFFIDRVITNSIPLIGSVDKLYSDLLPLLKGTIAPPSEDPRVWNPGQLGGSCTASAPLSLIRSQLGEDAYQEFLDIGRTEMVLKSFKQIKKGWGNNRTQRIVTLEVVKKLERSLEKRAIDIPEELTELKRQLEGMNTARKDLNTVKKPKSPESMTQNLEHAFALLKAGNFNHESIEAAELYIQNASLVSKTPLSDKELTELIKFSQHLTKYCKDRSLTKIQIHMMKEISSVLKNRVDSSLDQLNNVQKNKATKINKFYSLMQFYYDSIELTEDFEKEFHSSIPPYIPEGLAKLKKKMEK